MDSMNGCIIGIKEIGKMLKTLICGNNYGS
jgi:hypothetical protein